MDLHEQLKNKDIGELIDIAKRENCEFEFGTAKLNFLLKSRY